MEAVFFIAVLLSERDGCFVLSGFGRDVDCTAVSFALNVFGALNAEDEYEWSRITKHDLSRWKVTDANVTSLCQAFQTPT